MAHTLVRVLQGEHGEGTIHVVAPPRTAPLATRMPGVAAVHELDVAHGELGLCRRWRLAAELRAHRFQAAYVLPNSFKSALLPWWAWIPQRVGWHGETRYGLLTDRRRLDAARHPRMIDRFMSLALPEGAPLPEPVPRPQLSVDRVNRQSVLERLKLWPRKSHQADRLDADVSTSPDLQRHVQGLPPNALQPETPSNPFDRTQSPLMPAQRNADAPAAQSDETGGADERDRRQSTGLDPSGSFDVDGIEFPAKDEDADRGRFPPIAVLCPGAEYGEAKRWPAAHFAVVAKERLAAGHVVWILGSAADTATAAEIVREAPDAMDLTGQTSLLDAIDLLSLADVVVTNDSGLMHVACALGRKVVAIFGSTSPEFTPPLSRQATVIQDRLDCRPCFQRQCPLEHLDCLRGIAPERVIAALAR